MIDNDNVNWLHQSINIYQKFFPKVKFDWTTYFNSGFLIYNETHNIETTYLGVLTYSKVSIETYSKRTCSQLVLL